MNRFEHLGLLLIGAAMGTAIGVLAYKVFVLFPDMPPSHRLTLFSVSLLAVGIFFLIVGARSKRPGDRTDDSTDETVA